MLKTLMRVEEFIPTTKNKSLVVFRHRNEVDCFDQQLVLEDFKDELDILFIDIDLYANIAYQYDVTRVPTTILFNQNQLVKKEVGLLTKEQVRKLIDYKKRKK